VAYARYLPRDSLAQVEYREP